MRKKRQQELKKLDLTDEEIKQLKKLSRYELLTDAITLLMILLGLTVAIILGSNILGS